MFCSFRISVWFSRSVPCARNGCTYTQGTLRQHAPPLSHTTAHDYNNICIQYHPVGLFVPQIGLFMVPSHVYAHSTHVLRSPDVQLGRRAAHEAIKIRISGGCPRLLQLTRTPCSRHASSTTVPCKHATIRPIKSTYRTLYFVSRREVAAKCS